jgi:hypothetical protein
LRISSFQKTVISAVVKVFRVEVGELGHETKAVLFYADEAQAVHVALAC